MICAARCLRHNFRDSGGIWFLSVNLDGVERADVPLLNMIAVNCAE